MLCLLAFVKLWLTYIQTKDLSQGIFTVKAVKADILGPGQLYMYVLKSIAKTAITLSYQGGHLRSKEEIPSVNTSYLRQTDRHLFFQ